MKKNKIIGALIAVVGVGIAVSSSFALYQNIADDQSFNITLTTPEASEGTVQYSFGDVTNSLGESKLSPNARTQVFTVPLQGSYGAGIIAQDYIVGKIGISLTGDLASYLDISAKVIGYTDGKIGATTYGGNIGFTDNAASAEVAVSTNGAQKIQVTLSLKDTVTSENFLTYAEMNYNVALSWQAPTAFEYAYIAGDKTGWAADWDEYKMVPNIEANNWEWMFKGLTGFTQLKIVKDSTWVGLDGGGNIVVDASKTYQVYWNGSATHLAVSTHEGINYIS